MLSTVAASFTPHFARDAWPRLSCCFSHRVTGNGNDYFHNPSGACIRSEWISRTVEIHKICVLILQDNIKNVAFVHDTLMARTRKWHCASIIILIGWIFAAPGIHPVALKDNKWNITLLRCGLWKCRGRNRCVGRNKAAGDCVCDFYRPPSAGDLQERSFFSQHAPGLTFPPSPPRASPPFYIAHLEAKNEQ